MLINIIIPTSGRPSTLVHTLKSCLEQQYEKLNIIVSDNSLDYKTREIIDSYNDSRIKYVKPNRRLCMAENWEFALSQVNDGICTIIGDDDAIMPGGVEFVKDFFTHNPESNVLTHIPGNYLWPDYPSPELQNTLSIRRIDFQMRNYNSNKVLDKVLNYNEWYGSLPFLYHGFITVSHIRKIKSKTRYPFFNFCAPDIYSDLVLGLFTGNYSVISTALTLGGQSGKSTGANFPLRNEIANEFITELPPELTFRYKSRSFALVIYNAFENLKKAFPLEAANLVMNRAALLEASLKEAKNLGGLDEVEIRSILQEIFTEDEMINENGNEVKDHPSNISLASKSIGKIRAYIAQFLSSNIHKIKDDLKSTAPLPPLNAPLDFFACDDYSLARESGGKVDAFKVSNVYEASLFLQTAINAFQLTRSPKVGAI